MEIVNDDMIVLRVLAEMLGIMFPDVENAPARTGVNVPRNGRKIVDSLHYAIFEGIFPAPDLSEFIDEIPMQSIRSLSQLFASYRENVVREFMKVFALFAGGLCTFIFRSFVAIANRATKNIRTHSMPLNGVFAINMIPVGIGIIFAVLRHSGKF